jgi:cell wall-associated NlpC family hydrolase
MRRKRMAGTVVMAVAGSLACSAMIASPALAGSGGVAPPGSTSSTCKKKATLVSGRAVAPNCAPDRIKRAIRFANRIRNKPYVYGGGHSGWSMDNGYDCSGAVSYALHGARMLRSPEPSGPLMHWGVSGRGRWITVFANGGHAYAVIAGLRWDTSNVSGSGPSWSTNMTDGNGPFAVRHYRRF